MKKLLSLLALSLLSISISSAQEEEDQEFGFVKGDVFLTGSISYSNSTNANIERKSFDFVPSASFFISDHFSINGGLLIGSEKSENLLSGNRFDDKSFGFVVGASYYFNTDERFTFLLNLSAAYQSVDFTDTAGFETKINETAVALAPGINYFLSDRFALQATLGAINYGKVTNDDGVYPESDRFAIALDLSNIGFGVIYRL